MPDQQAVGPQSKRSLVAPAFHVILICGYVLLGVGQLGITIWLYSLGSDANSELLEDITNIQLKLPFFVALGITSLGVGITAALKKRVSVWLCWIALFLYVGINSFESILYFGPGGFFMVENGFQLWVLLRAVSVIVLMWTARALSYK